MNWKKNPSGAGRSYMKKRREILWKRQAGLCHYCSVPMVHWDDRDMNHEKQNAEQRKLWATLEHLRDRLHPLRNDGNPNFEARWVIACWKCNHDRGRENLIALPIEERRQRSQAGHERNRGDVR